MKKIILKGKIVEGRRIASGLEFAPEIPETKYAGTIDLQRNFFKEAGVENIDTIYGGTINVDISPNKFKILEPDHEITCEWAKGVEETFHLVGASIKHAGKEHEGYIYYPCPSEFKSHDDDKIEFLTYEVDGIQYGDEISVIVEGGKITVL